MQLRPVPEVFQARAVSVLDRESRVHCFRGHLEIARTAASLTVTVNGRDAFLFVKPRSVSCEDTQPTKKERKH
jgi:hypothetical protein